MDNVLKLDAEILAATGCTAEVVVGCRDIQAALAFYVDGLGFRVDTIFPAESPEVAVLRGYGIRLRLDPAAMSTVNLRLSVEDIVGIGGPAVLTAPDGSTVELVDAHPPIVLPPIDQSFVLERASDEAAWTVGRAGMRYRDLIPGRQGGRFVASHIHVPTAGPVPDYVHYHQVRFQMIFCYRGWTRLVYEDQGQPFIMHAGDCVLQPPTIRHRVLESSANLEVIEIGCPALHETHADPDMTLPTVVDAPDRLFGGQRFVFHQASTATWESDAPGWERRRAGLREATSGLAEASVIRPDHGLTGPARTMESHAGEFLFDFVLDGTMTLERSERPPQPLRKGDSFVMPAGDQFARVEASKDLELLEVTLPG